MAIAIQQCIRHLFYPSRTRATGGLRDRRHHGDLLGQVTFGHKLVPLVPDRKRVQQRVGKSRVWRYVLTPLAECRAAFETWIGAQIDWTGDDDDSDILELL